MAKYPTFNVYGLDELALDMRKVENIPDDIKINIAKSGAEVLAEGTRNTGKEMDIYDPESNVHILEKIKVSKPNIKKSIKAYVTFSGSRKRGGVRVRNAEIAFINEFGANQKGIPAKPFVKNAIAKYSAKAVEAAAKVFYDWLNKNNL